MLQQTSLVKKILKIILSIILITILILTFIFLNQENKTKTDGNIIVIVNDINNEVISKKRISFQNGDSLFELLNENYDLTFKDDAYGHYILGISDESFSIITSGDTTGWIWFELAYLKDGREFNEDIDFNNYDIIDVRTGIDQIELKDEMIFGINQRDNEHETTIFENNIELNNTNKLLKDIFLIIIIVLVIVFLILIVVCFIKNKNQEAKSITVRQICIIAAMSTILFVQEQVLTFLPNVQITFLLITLYTVIFGFKKTSIIIFIHVLLDNIIMGSFNPIVMLPMYIGYEIASLLIYLVRNKNIYFITIMASIGTIIYSISFLIANAFFLNVDIIAYILADIPFEIILVISTILSIMYLYKPLEKIIRKEWEKEI